jgi:hypothetical protein
VSLSGTVGLEGSGRGSGFFRATIGLALLRRRRRGGAPGGGVGFWPLGPPDGDALIIDGCALATPAGAWWWLKGNVVTGPELYEVQTSIGIDSHRAVI